ncbi:MAG: hypothetical protein AVDCRST_MAG27-1199, partial [uncultured Craurococcus sp.]
AQPSYRARHGARPRRARHRPAGLAERADPARRALPARRERRCHLAAAAAASLVSARRAGRRREQGRGLGVDRHAGRGAFGTRREQLGAGLRHPCGEPGADPEHGLRHAEGPGAGPVDRHLAHGHHRLPQPALAGLRRGGGGGEGEAGDDQLRHHRQRLARASDDEAGGEGGGHQPPPCALSRGRTARRRRLGRGGRSTDGNGDDLRAAARGEEHPAAGEHGGEALHRRAGGADADGTRHRRDGRGLLGRARASGDAGADPRALRGGAARGTEGAGGAGAADGDARPRSRPEGTRGIRRFPRQGYRDLGARGARERHQARL